MQVLADGEFPIHGGEVRLVDGEGWAAAVDAEGAAAVLVLKVKYASMRATGRR